jgi:purine-binding chemotaxis protein CheW
MPQVGHTASRETSEAGVPVRCLVFRAGALLAALPLDDVVETMRPLPVRPLAGTQPFVLGLTILRGQPAPVVDVALLLSGDTAAASRFVAVTTPRGPVALATGDVIGLRDTAGDAVQQHTGLLGPAPARLVDAVGSLDGEPLFRLRSLAMVPDEVWVAVAGTGEGPQP